MRVLIADPQPKVRFALRVLLQRQPDIEVVGEAIDACSLLAHARSDCPDLILLGWELPGETMECLLPALRNACPQAVVIALSGRLEAQRSAITAGVDVFVSKSAPPEQLLAAIASSAARCPKDRHRQPSKEPDSGGSSCQD
jgi:DNA-binding NarL/FixJ family response regulator